MVILIFKSKVFKSFAQLIVITIYVSMSNVAIAEAKDNSTDSSNILLEKLHSRLNVWDNTNNSLVLINQNIELISENHELTTVAMVLARENGDLELALHIANEALAKDVKTPRIFFELGVIFLLQGQCHEASLIFSALIQEDNVNSAIGYGEVDDWIKAESKEALKLCKPPQIWIYDYDYTLSYNENLANIVPLSVVKPEEDSNLGRSIKSLNKIIPDLPNEVIIGEKQTKGVVLTLNQYLDTYFQNAGKKYGVHIGADIGLTKPAGYERVGLSLGLSRSQISKFLSNINGLSARIQRTEKGHHKGSADYFSLQAQSLVKLRQRYSPGLFMLIEHQEFKSTSYLENLRLLGSFQFQHIPTNTTGLNWFFDIGIKTDEFSDPNLSQKSRFQSLGFKDVILNAASRLSFSLTLEQTSPEQPLPWLENVHTTHSKHMNLVYHTKFRNRPIDITATLSDSYSLNQIDNFQRFNLSFRFK